MCQKKNNVFSDFLSLISVVTLPGRMRRLPGAHRPAFIFFQQMDYENNIQESFEFYCKDVQFKLLERFPTPPQQGAFPSVNSQSKETHPQLLTLFAPGELYSQIYLAK